MFRGSVPRPVMQLMMEYVDDWGPTPDIYIGCSGSFTVERYLQDSGARLHSNDVLLYSAAVGNYYSGNPMDLVLTESGREDMPWMEKYLGDPLRDLAAMHVASNLAITVGKAHDGSPYYRKLIDAYESQFDTMHEQMIEQIKNFSMKIDSYDSEDVLTWLDRVPEDAAVVAYPPFQATGAASYFQKDYTVLERLFDWQPPEYQLLEKDTLTELYLKIAEREKWTFAVNKPVEELADYLVAKIQTTNRSPHIHVYSSHGQKRIITPHQSTTQLPYEHIGPEDELGDEMKLIPITGDQFQGLRSMYMNKGIKPGAADLALAVIVDDLFVGAIAWSWAPTFADWGKYVPPPVAYLLSDFPVDSSSYTRLSKLIVASAKSVEAQKLLTRYGKRPYRSFTTTAFSKNPVSMKYRGTLKLLKREENDAYKSSYADNLPEEDSYYSRPWNLQYGDSFGEETCTEILAQWKKKHGKARK